jgi:hypothetical protein
MTPQQDMDQRHDLLSRIPGCELKNGDCEALLTLYRFIEEDHEGIHKCCDTASLTSRVDSPGGTDPGSLNSTRSPSRFSDIPFDLAPVPSRFACRVGL